MIPVFLPQVIVLPVDLLQLVQDVVKVFRRRIGFALAGFRRSGRDDELSGWFGREGVVDDAAEEGGVGGKRRVVDARDGRCARARWERIGGRCRG